MRRLTYRRYLEELPSASGQITSTRIAWCPVAPSGNGGRSPRSACRPLRRWRAPPANANPASPPIDRPTAATCRSCPRAPSSAGTHAPSSTRTSTRSIPRCCAHATPATATGPGASCARELGRVDPRLRLDGRFLGPPPLDPVGVVGVERRELEVDEPLHRGDVAVEPGHEHPHGEPVLQGQGLAVHRDGEHRVPSVHHDGGRRADRETVGGP